mmetsp:Transcript_6399/g.28185  ORF Transcript_6399/g.28185 Transcript_6399/m.28185 type:complete len:246 (-) Transcript_6399:14-751(-)
MRLRRVRSDEERVRGNLRPQGAPPDRSIPRDSPRGRVHVREDCGQVPLVGGHRLRGAHPHRQLRPAQRHVRRAHQDRRVRGEARRDPVGRGQALRVVGAVSGKVARVSQRVHGRPRGGAAEGGALPAVPLQAAVAAVAVADEEEGGERAEAGAGAGAAARGGGSVQPGAQAVGGAVQAGGVPDRQPGERVLRADPGDRDREPEKADARGGVAGMRGRGARRRLKGVRRGRRLLDYRDSMMYTEYR